MESAGLSVNADYVRLQMFRNGVELERSEINASDIIAGAGTNLIPGGATKTWTLTLRFNDDRWTTYNLFFHFTDAKGNQFTATVPGFPDLTTTAQALSRDRGQSLPTL